MTVFSWAVLAAGPLWLAQSEIPPPATSAEEVAPAPVAPSTTPPAPAPSSPPAETPAEIATRLEAMVQAQGQADPFRNPSAVGGEVPRHHMVLDLATTAGRILAPCAECVPGDLTLYPGTPIFSLTFMAPLPGRFTLVRVIDTGTPIETDFAPRLGVRYAVPEIFLKRSTNFQLTAGYGIRRAWHYVGWNSSPDAPEPPPSSFVDLSRRTGGVDLMISHEIPDYVPTRRVRYLSLRGAWSFEKLTTVSEDLSGVSSESVNWSTVGANGGLALGSTGPRHARGYTTWREIGPQLVGLHSNVGEWDFYPGFEARIGFSWDTRPTR